MTIVLYTIASVVQMKVIFHDFPENDYNNDWNSPGILPATMHNIEKVNSFLSFYEVGF